MDGCASGFFNFIIDPQYSRKEGTVWCPRDVESQSSQRVIVQNRSSADTLRSLCLATLSIAGTPRA